MTATPMHARYFDDTVTFISESKRSAWTGRVLTSLAVLFLAFDASMKFFLTPEALEGTGNLGFPLSLMIPIAIIEIICLVLYVVPRTSVLGAVLWTGYLGGAIATHVRVENPLLTHTLFPIYIAALIWGGLWFRDARVRGMVARPRRARG